MSATEGNLETKASPIIHLTDGRDKIKTAGRKCGNRKEKKFIMVISAGILVLSAVLYLLADRYLIEHVQVQNVSNKGSAISSDLSMNDSSSGTENGTDAITTSDDWNYQSGSSTISVRQVTTGTGNDTLTYYVADVAVSDATVLQSAFAKNQFGTNIIEVPSAIASDNNAIFAINGDYYGFREDGIVIRNGVIFRDVPARTGLALYLDGTMKVYDETTTSAQELLEAGVWNTLSFGPAIVGNSEIPPGIEQIEVDTNFGNHSIQGSQPRTGVGIIDANHFVFIVADGRSPGYSKGVTMTEFAGIFQGLGCATAYNIDGGGSSTMYFNGRVVNNPLGRNRERGTSDILYIAKAD